MGLDDARQVAFGLHMAKSSAGARLEEAALSEGACDGQVCFVPRVGPLRGRIRWGWFCGEANAQKSSPQKHCKTSLAERAGSWCPNSSIPQRRSRREPPLCRALFTKCGLPMDPAFLSEKGRGMGLDDAYQVAFGLRGAKSSPWLIARLRFSNAYALPLVDNPLPRSKK